MGSPGLGRHLAITVRQRPLVCMGRFKEALGELDELPTSSFVDIWRMLSLAHSGQTGEAKAAIECFLMANCIDEDETPSVFLAMLLEASLRIGDRDHAAPLANQLEPLADLAATQENAVCVARLLGGAAALLGEPERAMAYYRQALDVAARAGNHPELALTHLQMTKLLLKEADSRQPIGISSPPTCRERQTSASLAAQSQGGGSLQAEALQHLDLAISEFRAMKMQPALDLALRQKDALK